MGFIFGYILGRSSNYDVRIPHGMSYMGIFSEEIKLEELEDIVFKSFSQSKIVKEKNETN